jgi:hypothetical protein
VPSRNPVPCPAGEIIWQPRRTARIAPACDCAEELLAGLSLAGGAALSILLAGGAHLPEHIIGQLRVQVVEHHEPLVHTSAVGIQPKRLPCHVSVLIEAN